MLGLVSKICPIFMIILAFSAAQKDDEDYFSDEKLLPIIDMGMEFYHYISNLYTNCESGNFTVEESSKCLCGMKQKIETYTEIAVKLVRMAKRKNLVCGPLSEESAPVLVKAKALPVDCLDALERGQKVSGIYKIKPNALNTSLDVYCDMETKGGGWTVIQRRGNYSVQEKFFRSWKSYKRGFGNISRDFWLGNDNIHILSSQGDHSVRFEMEDVEGEKRYAQYDHFRVDNEDEQYKLHIYGYSGDAGDSMGPHNQLTFSTIFSRNDNRGEDLTDCAIVSESGWWFDSCSETNPNGVYAPGKTDDDFKYVFWRAWKKYEGLKSFQIKIRRTDDV